MAVPKTTQLVATVRTTSGNVVSTGAVNWQSSKAAVATVSTSGLVTAVAPGKAIVTATLNHQSGSATVLVEAVDHIVVFPTIASIPSGAARAFTATAYDANNEVVTTPTLQWASSSSRVATIDASGVASGVAPGLATISATVGSRTANATLNVTTVASCSLVTDLSARQMSAFAKPAYLRTVTEPDFRTMITRIAGDPGTAIGNGVSGTWPSTAARHEYSKSQAWSADGKLLNLSAMSGAVGPGVQLYLDGETYQPLFARSHPGPEARWHPTLPDIMIYVASNGSIGHWNVRTNTSALKFTTTAYSNAYMGNYEGNPSFDGRYILVNATRNSDGRAVVYVVDITAGTKTADSDILAQGFATAADLDFASVSASGNYFMLWGKINGVAQAAKVFTRDGALVQTWTDFRVGHADLGYDAAGNDVLFSAAVNGANAKKFLIRRLDTGAVTLLSPAISYDWHASTKDMSRPGWGYGDTGDRTGTALDGQVYALKMDGSNTVERLAFHRSTSSSYNAQPQASPSPDGRRVIFASDWGVARGPVQAYIVDTRQLCPNGLP